MSDDITLKDIHNDLRELLKWTKFAGLKEVKLALESNVTTDEEKIIFSLSNGTNSSYKIARKMGANDTTRRKISDYWDKWEKAGLGEPQSSQGPGNRFKRSFDLDEFGISVPPIPETQTGQQPTDNESINSQGDENDN